MRKLQLASIALAAIVGGANAAPAQAPVAAPTKDTTPVATQAAPSIRSHRHHHHGLFRGVELSTEQRAKVAAMRDQSRAEAMPIVTQMRAAHVDLRGARTRNDSAAVTAARAKLSESRAQLSQMRDRWINNARGLLTPVQQARFDRNVARHKAAWARHHHHHHHHRRTA